MIKLIKEYRKYNEKPISAFAIVLNMVVLTAVPLVLLWILFADISENSVFGLIVAGAVAGFLFFEISGYIKNVINSKLPLLREAYMDNQKIKCLNELSEDEFRALAIKYISGIKPELSFKRDGLFYSSGKIVIVFLWLPEKKDISTEKANMAFKVGAKKIITVSTDAVKHEIVEKFGEKAELAVTLDEIIASSPEIEIKTDENEKICFDWKQFINKKTASKLFKVSLWCFLISVVAVNRRFYIISGLILAVIAAGIRAKCRN